MFPFLLHLYHFYLQTAAEDNISVTLLLSEGLSTCIIQTNEHPKKSQLQLEKVCVVANLLLQWFNSDIIDESTHTILPQASRSFSAPLYLPSWNQYLSSQPSISLRPPLLKLSTLCFAESSLVNWTHILVTFHRAKNHLQTSSWRTGSAVRQNTRPSCGAFRVNVCTSALCYS